MKWLGSDRNRFTELMKNVDDAVYIVDSEGKIIQASDSTSLQLGYDMDTLLNLKHDNLLPENDVRIIHSLLDRNWSANHYSDAPTKTTIESYHIAKDGNQVPVEIRARAIIYQSRKAILNVARDISNRKAVEHEKKQLETQLLHAQKMEAIGTLAGGVAHDFNNLLQVIHGYTELLIKLKNSDDPELNQLEEIRNAAQRASELTDQLLTFSRKTESNTKPIELNDEIVKSCRLLKSTLPSGIVLESRLTDDLMMINADPGQIQQVVMNLGVNARDAMPEGGQLIIETKNISIDEIDCKTCLEATPGKYVCLSVSDNGNGIDSETIKHIFEPFFTTKDTGKGTGLGLAIVYGIVKNAGGFLNCYSEIGLGTTIRAYFPAIQSSIALMQPINEPDFSESPRVLLNERSSVINDQKWRGSETILLVDDEEQIRDLIITALPQYGYTVLDAANGVEALSVYKARREEIDLVILDMIMPEMDGKKCFQELKELDPAIRVVMSSGYSVSGSYRNLESGGVKAFIDKPYRFGQMLETIRKIFDGEENHDG